MTHGSNVAPGCAARLAFGLLKNIPKRSPMSAATLAAADVMRRQWAGFRLCFPAIGVATTDWTSRSFKAMAKKSVSLSVGRGEKLPTKQGAGLTAKGRERYNRETGSNLKAPAPNPKTEADKGRKASFCGRMQGVVDKASGPAERAKAALKRWKC